jgi:hypothetical protein
MRTEKLRLVMAAGFGAAAVWAIAKGSWIAPALIALAVAQVLILRVRLQAQRALASDASLVGYLGLTYLGCAYGLAVFVATPRDWRFWLVFGMEVVILGPVVLLFARHVLPARTHDEPR